LKKHLKLYADAGGSYITTYAVHSPWSDNSYRIEGTMIEWIKRKDGWKFDYTIFDQYVQLAMEVGIDKAITMMPGLPIRLEMPVTLYGRPVIAFSFTPEATPVYGLRS